MRRFSTFLTKLLKKLSSKVRLGRTRGRAGVIVTSILVRRTGAFGDVIDTTPVVRRLRQENPDAEIDVDTQYPHVFLNSPHRIGFSAILPTTG